MASGRTLGEVWFPCRALKLRPHPDKVVGKSRNNPTHRGCRPMPTERIASLDTATISRILGAAVSEFADRPYSDASFNRVIRDAGISKGMMYYYFKSKEDLFTALLHSAVRRFLQRVGPVPQVLTAESFWGACDHLLGAFFGFMTEEGPLARFLRQIFQSASAAAASPAHLAARGLGQWLAGFVVVGRRVGAVRNDRPVDWLVAVAWANWSLVVADLTHGDMGVAEARAITLDLLQRTLEV